MDEGFKFNVRKYVKVGSIKNRGLHELSLPDQEIGGGALYNGQMTGLTNLSRRGDALLEAETDHFLFSFTLQGRNSMLCGTFRVCMSTADSVGLTLHWGSSAKTRKSEYKTTTSTKPNKGVRRQGRVLVA